MIELREKEIAVIEPSTEKLELKTYLDTYIRQRNQMVSTYEWMKPKLNAMQCHEWDRTIKALETVCKVLDAGFDPIAPPKNWASGLLIQYLAPIPEQVREAIDRAEPIFGRDRILIYDPNAEHFQRPRKTDPLAIGFIDLAAQRLHFLIGQWNLEADLKFIKGSRRLQQAGRAVDNVIATVGTGSTMLGDTISNWKIADDADDATILQSPRLESWNTTNWTYVMTNTANS